MKVYRKYSGFDYLFCIVIVVLTFINFRSLQFYFAGRFNLGRFLDLFCLHYWLIFLLIFYLIICWLVLIVIRVLSNWHKAGIKDGIKRFLLILFLASAVIFALTRQVPFFEYTYMKGFRKRMLVRADIPAIQAWLTERGDYNNGDTITPSAWPRAVKKLSPDSFRFGTDEGVCYLTWNGSHGEQWGLVVGLSPMEIPDLRDHGRYHISLSEWDQTESFEAYVWYIEGR
jgi:hypothetical protein